MYRLLTTLLLTACISAGCSNDQEPVKEHVWKSQTDSISDAQNAARELEKSMQLQQQKIDNAR